MKRLLLTISLITALAVVSLAQLNLATDGSKASASSFTPPGTVAETFDADTSTGWTVFGGFPQWIHYDFETPVLVDGYAMHYLVPGSYETHENMQPTDWIFQGSNDAVAWDDLNTITADPVSDTWEFFAATNVTSYRYYRLNITAGGDDTLAIGELQMYVTLIPTVITNAVTYVEAELAACGGNVVTNGGAPIIQRGICYNTTGNPTIAGSYRTTTPGDGPFSVDLINLTPNTLYYCRAFASNAKGISYGSVQTFTTLKMDQTITFDPLADQTYGDSDFDPGATASSGLTVSYESSDETVATIVSGNVHIVGAGTTTITASQAGDATYNPASPVPQTLTVNKANLDVTADDKEKVYGDTIPELTVTITGFVLGDDESDLTVLPVASTTADSASSAGVYDIDVSGGDDENYDFTYTVGLLTITKTTLTVMADSASKAYGDTIPDLTFTYEGFIGDDDESVLETPPITSTDATEESDVGKYLIRLSDGVDENYDFNYVHDTLYITKVMLNASVTSTSKTYGEANPIIEVSITGFVLDQDASVLDIPPSIGLDTDETSDVGVYDITISGGQDNNYDFEYVDGTLTIEQATLTATAGDASRDEGVDNPEFTITYSGFVNNDNESDIDVLPTATCSADASSAPGTYDIVVAGGSDNNYAFEYINGTLTVNEVIDALSSDPLSAITIYPNPVEDILVIETDQAIQHIQIINSAGRIITNYKPTSNTLDVSGLPTGIYILKIETGIGLSVERRFVKQ